MRFRVTRSSVPVFVALGLAVLAAGCGGGGDGADPVPSTDPPAPVDPGPSDPGPADPGPSDPPPTEEPQCDQTFESTFEAVQTLVFARHGCAANACHGSTQAGGLDLRPDVAHANLLEVPSNGSTLPLIAPGDNDRSYLWLKLAAKTNPGSVDIQGSPMPIGASTLTEEELELVRVWIKGGAPETGNVLEAEPLLDGCVPEAEPIVITPLTPPDPAEGIQFVMPEYDLNAGTEVEVCFAQQYDVRDQIPDAFLNEAGTHFRARSTDLRQDPQSHHLILIHYGGDAPASEFGDFFCKGGERDGQPCDPGDFGECGEGLCATLPVPAVGCTGFGPDGGNPFSQETVLVVQQSQETQEFDDGVYLEVPVSGVWMWNSHAFNLTTFDARMHARVNYMYAENQVYVVNRIFDASQIFAMNTPPFAKETVCKPLTFPQGERVFNLISHTHERGERFWVNDPSGTMIYENFVYNDPLNLYYDPPIEFDSADAADRTLNYCATYNNGVAPDGSPDVSVVKRASETPPNAFRRCNPTACVAGRVGEACNGENDDATCDSSPGAGDGDCDACVLRGGVSTEDEMFILLGASYNVN